MFLKKLCPFVLLLTLQSQLFGQSNPVQWTAEAIRNAEGEYTLRVKGMVETGWQVYATDDSTLGLEAVQLQWENTNVIRSGGLFNKQPLLDFKAVLFENKSVKVYGSAVELVQDIKINGAIPAIFSVTVHGFASREDEFQPLETTIDIPLQGGIAKTDKLSTINLQSPVNDCGEKIVASSQSLWAIFIKGVLGGLLALLMPCIFPMLPVTVSFFMNRAKTKREGIRNGILYGTFILLIYVLASSPFHIMGNVNPQIFNNIATNKWINLLFFSVFLIFALSLFGLFELRLPGANSAGKKSGAGSIGGIFFMALTLAIVSFSCTGPILGFLLVNSINETNGAWALTAGMAGFGMALAFPFGLFAMFPQWLKKLPKSGGWMETLKKSLAFVELALALKFLSNADLVEHWGIVKREVFIAIWLLITLGLALYLLNIIWLVKYGKLNISKGRLLFGALALFFAAYLSAGLTQTKYANLKWVSGFPPPLSYSIYGKKNVHGKGLEPDVINDYEKALAMSRETNKPLLIDFTGWACVNCRKMEENVWTKSAIKDLIDSNFILVSLYVDDRAKLEDGTTMGKKWASFQSVNFGSASQPQYVILSPGEQLLVHPVGYSPAESYKEWLECGLSAYKNGNKKIAKNGNYRK